MKMRQDELMEILAQAGPKGKEIANAIGKRRSIEVHFHLTGPVFIGSDIARTIAPLFFRPDGPLNRAATPGSPTAGATER